MDQMGKGGKHFRIVHDSLCIFVTIKKQNNFSMMNLKFFLILPEMPLVLQEVCVSVGVGWGGGH